MRSMARSGRAGMGAAVLAMLVSLAPGLARAGEVLVVRSSDLAAYKAVEKAFVASFDGNVKLVSLADPAAAAGLPAAVPGADLVLAVGQEAAKAAAAARPKALLVALVPASQKIGLEHKQLLPMFVPAPVQLKAFRAALPSLKRVGLLYDPSLSQVLAGEYAAAATAAGLAVVKSEVTSREAVAGAARALMPQVDALWLIPDTTVISAESFKFLVQSSVAAKVALLGFSEGMTRAGALVSVEATHAEIGKLAAAAAKRILSGGAAAPEAPAGSVFLNAKTAAMLGLTLPQAARDGATKVFE